MPDIKHAYTHRVVCPHCGFSFEGSREWEEDGDATECDECGGRFVWAREVEVHYHSWKVP